MVHGRRARRPQLRHLLRENWRVDRLGQQQQLLQVQWVRLKSDQWVPTVCSPEQKNTADCNRQALYVAFRQPKRS
jgi:hypothetical protein|eukprot:COSAG06_NODE_142_length_22286_cov_5.328751_12_plen_75_part_00